MVGLSLTGGLLHFHVMLHFEITYLALQGPFMGVPLTSAVGVHRYFYVCHGMIPTRIPNLTSHTQETYF